jgi:uncharacterized protein (TIGR00290 family)
MRIPVLLSWSGGKDSAWALHVLRNDPRHEVVGLLTTVTDAYDRVAMHGIRRDVLHAQAAAAGLPLVEARLPRDPDNDAYEAAFASALDSARAQSPALRHVAFGDLFLADVRAYRDALCARLGWTGVYPLWESDTGVLAGRMIEGGLRATLCCVDTTQLDARFAGRPFDADLLDDLPAGVDRCGERGEFHTCVHAGPMFAQPLALRTGENVLRDGRFAFTDLLLV